MAPVNFSSSLAPFGQTNVYSDKTKECLAQGQYVMCNSPDPVCQTLMDTVAQIQTFFWNNFQLVGADDQGKIPAFFINQGDKKALYRRQGAGDPECFKFEIQYIQYPEVVCHEFTHAAMQNLRDVSLGNQGQLGAINEAIADVVGVVFKQSISGQYSDWKVRGTSRDLSNPFTVSNVNPEFAPKEGNDNGHVHSNSKLLSHAFYLASQKLAKVNTDREHKRLLKVWFNAARYLEINSQKQDYFAEFAKSTIHFTQNEPDGSVLLPYVQSAWEAVGFSFKN